MFCCKVKPVALAMLRIFSLDDSAQSECSLMLQGTADYLQRISCCSSPLRSGMIWTQQFGICHTEFIGMAGESDGQPSVEIWRTRKSAAVYTYDVYVYIHI